MSNRPIANTQNQPSGCQNLLLKWTLIIYAHGGLVAKMGNNEVPIMPVLFFVHSMLYSFGHRTNES